MKKKKEHLAKKHTGRITKADIKKAQILTKKIKGKSGEIKSKPHEFKEGEFNPFGNGKRIKGKETVKYIVRVAVYSKKVRKKPVKLSSSYKKSVIKYKNQKNKIVKVNVRNHNIKDGKINRKYISYVMDDLDLIEKSLHDLQKKESKNKSTKDITFNIQPFTGKYKFTGKKVGIDKGTRTVKAKRSSLIKKRNKFNFQNEVIRILNELEEAIINEEFYNPKG